MFSDLIKELEDMVSKMDDLKRLKSTGRDYTTSMVSKKVEDGILDKIHTANDHQLNIIMNSYKFYYYTEYNNKEVLRAEIQKRIREHKLKEILDGKEE